jgi:hypothetical protein
VKRDSTFVPAMAIFAMVEPKFVGSVHENGPMRWEFAKACPELAMMGRELIAGRLISGASGSAGA